MAKPILEYIGTRKDKRTGHWEVSYYVINGFEKSRKYKGGFKLKGTAKDWFERFRAQVEAGAVKLDIDTGKPVPSEKVTLNQLLEHQKVASAQKRESTQLSEELGLNNFKAFIKGETLISKISSLDVEKYLAHRQKQGRAARTISRELTQIRYCFQNAVRWGMIEKNPTDGIKKPKLPEGSVVYLSLKDQGSLITACKTISMEDQDHSSAKGAPYLYPMVLLACRTGMRRAELFNLKWKHVDLQQSRVRVESGKDFSTKSGRSRVLPLDEQCKEALKWWQNWFSQEIIRCRRRMSDTSLHKQLRVKAEARMLILEATRPHPSRLVFPSFKNPGQPMNNVDRSFEAALHKAFAVDEKLPEKYQVGLHALRHSFAVTCAVNHVPLALLSKLLGHADIQTTMIYLRFYPDDAADALNLPSIPC